MTVISKQIIVKTKGQEDILDITEKVCDAVTQSGLLNGIVTIFVIGSTGALTTIEYEKGLLNDLSKILERLSPKKFCYEHEKKWQDGNGHSHIRASLIGPSLSIPFIDGKLTLGTWQQIVFLELDVHSRIRNLILQIIGD